MIMRVQELLETTEEDRALISLSSAIYSKLQPYVGTTEDTVSLGKISDMADTPLIALTDVLIDIQGGDAFLRRLHDIPESDIVKKDEGSAAAFWDEDTDTVVFNRDFLNTKDSMTTVTHELRHALDSVKSNKFPNDANRYFTPKNKKHRKVYYTAAGEVDKDDPRNTIPYRAQPAEINARFSEILHQLSVLIPKRYKTVEAHLLRNQLIHDFGQLLIKYKITDLFPQKTKSPDYRRLVKRAYDFIQKEMSHIEAQPDTAKKAVGNW